MPTVFDLIAHFEPSAHFQYSRKVRNEFASLARKHAKFTWMLGRYGGRAQMQTDIQGIGVATRVEVGRLAFRQSSQTALIQSAFHLFEASQELGLVSGRIDRILAHFSKADARPRERESIRRAFGAAFGDSDCSFLCHDLNLLEVGKCVVYQSLVQYLREDGLYHSAHRNRIEIVRRHLQQEVGRYENYKFYVRPQQMDREVPKLDFCYTGATPDRRVEAFMEGYTEEHPLFVAPAEFQAQRGDYVELNDYERASRRFGGLWVLLGDIVRYLQPQQIGVLYLFFDPELRPELSRPFSWDELFARQRHSPYINRASRNSQTFLEIVMESLVRNRFVTPRPEGFVLTAGFEDFKHVTFYQLGEYRKRLQ
jgi:hypothetical protein